MNFETRLTTAALFLCAGASVVLVVHWQLWSALPVILSQDTLWHLSPYVRAMLVALSTCAVVATGLFCLVKSVGFWHRTNDRVTFHFSRWVSASLLDISITFLLLWGAVSLAPQLFYMLYVTVIPGLSPQWVAKFIEWPVFLELLKLTAADSMATLLAGAMMLTILVASLIFWLSIPARLLIAKR